MVLLEHFIGIFYICLCILVSFGNRVYVYLLKFLICIFPEFLGIVLCLSLDGWNSSDSRYLVIEFREHPDTFVSDAVFLTIHFPSSFRGCVVILIYPIELVFHQLHLVCQILIEDSKYVDEDAHYEVTKSVEEVVHSFSGFIPITIEYSVYCCQRSCYSFEESRYTFECSFEQTTYNLLEQFRLYNPCYCFTDIRKGFAHLVEYTFLGKVIHHRLYCLYQ